MTGKLSDQYEQEMRLIVGELQEWAALSDAIDELESVDFNGGEAGECYRAAFMVARLIESLIGRSDALEVRVVHGRCRLRIDNGQHKKGTPFIHAWAEVWLVRSGLRMAIDASVPTVPEVQVGLADLYYAEGRVSEVFAYTVDEAVKLMIDQNTWGPWEPELQGHL